MHDITLRDCGCSYDKLIESFEVENLLQVDDDSYQGDTRNLFRDGSRYGLLTFGWGSCPGCDALSDCDTDDEVRELRDELWSQIHWEDSAADTATYIATKDWTLDYGHDKEFLVQARNILAAL